MKRYEVTGPYPIAIIRDGEKVDVDPPDGLGGQGGTFLESEIEPGCQMDINVAAGLVTVVGDTDDDKAAVKAAEVKAVVKVAGGKP